MSTDRRCGTCTHYSATTDEAGAVRDYGWCECPIDRSQIPSSHWLEAEMVNEAWHEKCPRWEPKP